MISKETILKIADHIEKMDMFKDTVNERKMDMEFLHTHNAIELFDNIVIQSSYFDKCTNETEYYIYNPHTDILRKATQEEDDIMRSLDMGDMYFDEMPFMEREESEFIIGREPDNSITRPHFP